MKSTPLILLNEEKQKEIKAQTVEEFLSQHNPKFKDF